MSSNKKVIVYTYGAFDILHAGHTRLITKAKKLGDVLVVGVLSDEAIRGRKGEGRPVQTYKDRKEVILSLRDVDFVIKQETYDPVPTMLELPRVNAITKGDDYDVIEKAAKEYGCEVVKLQYSNDYSTSKIIDDIIK